MNCLNCDCYSPSSYEKMGFCTAPKDPNMQSVLLRARLFAPAQCWLPEWARPSEAVAQKKKANPSELAA